jgi:hypothetical protein
VGAKEEQKTAAGLLRRLLDKGTVKILSVGELLSAAAND